LPDLFGIETNAVKRWKAALEFSDGLSHHVTRSFRACPWAPVSAGTVLPHYGRTVARLAEMAVTSPAMRSNAAFPQISGNLQGLVFALDYTSCFEQPLLVCPINGFRLAPVARPANLRGRAPVATRRSSFRHYYPPRRALRKNIFRCVPALCFRTPRFALPE